MKRSTKPWQLFLILVSTLALALGNASATLAGEGNESVFPPNSKPYGKSYGEWSARFWQWAFSLPTTAHPLYDTADCSAGQSGKVWFLGGAFFSTEIAPGVLLGQANRKCEIPKGTALFFPIVNVEASTIEGNGQTEEELRDFANFLADFIVPESLRLEIDGECIRRLDRFRVESPLYVFGPLPEDNILGAPAGEFSPSVSDGVHIMLKPLKKGHHKIRFYGEIDLAPIGGPLVIQDITYRIRIVD
jgi:hypothetical protein